MTSQVRTCATCRHHARGHAIEIDPADLRAVGRPRGNRAAVRQAVRRKQLDPSDPLALADWIRAARQKAE